MLEIVMFVAIVGVLLYGISFSKSKRRIASSGCEAQHAAPPKEDGFSGNQFLLQLQKEIEDNLYPRPTDSVLVRHYDALVAVHLEQRLANMPNC